MKSIKTAITQSVVVLKTTVKMIMNHVHMNMVSLSVSICFSIFQNVFPFVRKEERERVQCET